MTVNRKTAQLLERVAAVFRVKEGDTFRVKAYTNAATAIDNLSEPIDELWRQDKLDTVPGLGEALIRHLNDYFKKGRVPHWETQFKKVPAGMFALMDIRGVGPMTAYKIAKKFHLNDERKAIKDLEKLIKEGKLKKLESFKERSVARLSKSLKIKSFDQNRILLPDALQIAESYLDYLKKSPLILGAEPLGSLRRRLPTVGDIDLAINTKDPDGALEYALTYPQVSSVITRNHVKLKNGFEVDIKVSSPEDWGSMLQHFTGSKMHNIRLRTLTKERGQSLSEDGILEKKKLHRFKTESDFYRYLGMPMIPPEIREDGGEIDLARENRIPDLVEITDIKGDLHIHSNYDYPSSHDLGVSSLAEIFEEAAKLNYDYVGISDHNPKFTGLTEKETEKILIARKKFLEQDFRAYEKRVKHRTINLLIGMEVDIRPDGSLALSDKLMNLLDYAIVSIHSGFDMDTEDATGRILEGLSHPKAIILGHPTGRMINSRDSITADWDKIFDFSAKNRKILEINADPHRADLPDDLIHRAIDHGVKLIINTDTHDASQINSMRYGVWQARKGYARKKDIVNSLSWRALQSVIK